MTLSKRGDYVVRSALCLAKAHPSGQSKKIREVVAEMAVPQTFASQILADLVRADLAISKAGRDGGYKLSRPPASISILEVVEAGEGSFKAQRCALGDGPCRWDSVCPMHEIWSAATAAFRESLKMATLADLVAKDQALDAGTYLVPSDSHRAQGFPVSVVDNMHVEVSLPVLRDLLDPSGSAYMAAATSAHRRAAKELGDRSSHNGSMTVSGRDLDGETPVISLELGNMDQHGEVFRLSVSWEGQGNGLATTLEAKLTFASLDPSRSIVSIDGTWDAHLFNSERFPSQSDNEATAKAAARQFLAWLAREAEERAPALRPL